MFSFAKFRKLSLCASSWTLALGGVLTTEAAGQLPTLVADIETEHSRGSLAYPSFPQEIAYDGEVAYFAADDGIHGLELWTSDGTADGTRLLVDLCPGACAGAPREITVAGGLVFFVADNGEHGHELFRTDGTLEGTFLLADLEPGPASSRPTRLFALGDSVLFSAVSAELGWEPWVSDGQPKGTRSLGDLFPGPESSRPGAFWRAGSRALFGAVGDGIGRELWVTDGTPAGTSLVGDLNPGGDFVDLALPYGIYRWASLGDGVVFPADDGGGLDAWYSDGTPAGTFELHPHDGHSGAGPSSFEAGAGGALYWATSGAGLEPWFTDGTPGGTAMLRDVRAGGDGSYGLYSKGTDDHVFFAAYDDADGVADLWVTDGTPEGTREVKDFSVPGVSSSGLLTITLLFVQLEWASAGGRVLFLADDGVHGAEWWGSDGTEQGTSLLIDAAPGGDIGAYRYLLSKGAPERALVWATTGPLDWARPVLLASDGTQEGTEVLARPSSQTSSLPYDITSRPDGTIAFGAYRSDIGLEPWMSDGSSSGTVPILDLAPGWDQLGLDPSYRSLATLGDRWLFAGTVGTYGSLEPWTTLGEAETTAQLATLNPPSSGAGGSFPVGFTPFGDRSYFWTLTPDQLHSTTGVPGEVTALPITGLSWLPTGNLSVALPHPHQGFLYVPAAAGLWRVDPGGAAEPVSLEVSDPSDLASVGDELYFVAETPAHGREVYRTDGDTVTLISDLLPGEGSGAWRPIHVAEFLYGAHYLPRRYETQGAALSDAYLFTGDDGGHGVELFRATSSGVELVRDLRSGAGSSFPRDLTVTATRVFFVANDGVHGAELWMSDGTSEGTSLVADLAPGARSSLPQSLFAWDESHLIFTAWTPWSGRELWITDGTLLRRVTDVAPGPSSSSPMELERAGERLYFTATDGVRGFELWSLDRPTAAASVPDLRAAKTIALDPQDATIALFTILLTNQGFGTQPDLPGDELVDELNPALTLLEAHASAGVLTTEDGSGRITWNGSLPPNAQVEITLRVAFDPNRVTALVNQALVLSDADGDPRNGNERLRGSDDPSLPGDQDATVLILAPAVPTLRGWLLGALAILLAAVALQRLR